MSKITIRILQFIMGCLIGFVVLHGMQIESLQNRLSAIESLFTTREAAENYATSPTTHAYYGICPQGSITSIEHFVRFVMTDDVARMAYHDIPFGEAYIDRVDKDMMRYVTYRWHEGHFWTQHPVQIKAGEAILVAKDRQIRLACCNEMSVTPRLPITLNEPRQAGWVLPHIKNSEDDKREREYEWSQNKEEWRVFPRRRTNMETPEPSTWILMGTGVLILAITTRRWK